MSMILIITLPMQSIVYYDTLVIPYHNIVTNKLPIIVCVLKVVQVLNSTFSLFYFILVANYKSVTYIS